MAVGELSDEALMAALRAHPELRQRVSSIVRAVEGDEGALKEADAAEERMVEETRLLGREALRSWAERRVEATEREIRQRPQMHRQGEKTPLAYEIRRNRGSGAAISVVCPVKAGMFSRGKACRGKNQRPRSLDSRVAGNQDSEAYRQRLPRGDDESPGRNESKRECGLENE